MHIHIHSLIYYVRHARQLGSSMRFLGAMLLMLLLGLLQFASARPASSVLTAKDNHQFSINSFRRDSTVSIRGMSDPAMDPRCRRVDRTDPPPPDAINKNSYTSLFYQLKPGIVMVPRMNRTPKPKSIYRCFTRAPGSAPASVQNDA